MKKIRAYISILENNKIKLFFTGLLQVSLVAVNTYQLAHKHYIGSFIVGFLISYIWTYNVKKISFGDNWDRVIYPLGAAFGTIIGLFISTKIYE